MSENLFTRQAHLPLPFVGEILWIMGMGTRWCWIILPVGARRGYWEYDDVLNMIDCEEISVAPIRLKYYRKPLKGSKQVLRAVSSYLKGDLDLGKMCMAYHIFAKEREVRSLRTQLIDSYNFDNRDIDIAHAAGLDLGQGEESKTEK